MVFLGDAVRSSVRLQPSSTTEAAMLALLGLPVGHGPPDVEESVRSVPSLPTAAELDPVPRSHETAEVPVLPPQRLPAPEVDPDRPASVIAVPSTIEQVVVGDPQVVWETDSHPLPRPAAGEEAYRLDSEPLLPRARSVDLLTAMAGVDEPTGSFDIARMTDRVARGEPSVEVRTRRTSRRHGVQLLIDVSAAMAPFAGDCAAVRGIVEALFGSGARVNRFVGSPLRGAGAGSRPWPAYRPPRPPTPVLVLTDLGLGPTGDVGERADVAEWLRFAHIVARAGGRVAALVPGPRTRVPASLLRAVDVVEWDDTTTTATVRRLVRR